MATNIWNGLISFGMVNIPVKLQVAARKESVSLNRVWRNEDGVLCAVGNKNYDKVSGTDLDRAAKLLKGYEVSDGNFVEITEQEVESCKTKSAKIIQISKFVPLSEVDPLLFENSYFVSVGEGGEHAFALVLEAMKRGNKTSGKNLVALGTWTYQNRENLVALRLMGRNLVMHTLFYEDEIRDIPAPCDYPINEKEVAVAVQVLSAMTGNFEHKDYQDSYRTRMSSIIKNKVEQASMFATKAKDDLKKAVMPEIDRVMDAFKASLAVMPAKTKTKKAGR